MKRKIMLPIAALAFCGTIMITTSCQKEENKETTIKTSEKNQQSAEDQAVEKRILEFKESTQNPTKDLTEIPADEALWNIEAALNYTYCMGAGAAVDPEVEETQIQFSLNENGLLNFTDVANEYLNLAAAHELKQSELEAEGKEFKLVDLTDITTPEELAEGKVVFQVITMDGVAPQENGNSRYITYTFGENDNWYYGEGLGKYPSGYEGWDAARLFTNVINVGVPMPNPFQIPAKKGYYTDPVTTTIDDCDITDYYANPDDPTSSGDNILDFLVFYKFKSAGITDTEKVLFYTPYDEMNFYMQNIEQIKLNLDAEYAGSGRTFKSFMVDDKQEFAVGNLVKIYHMLTFHYGVYHTGAQN